MPFVKGDKNINRTGKQYLVIKALRLFSAWGLTRESVFPIDKPLPKNYKDEPVLVYDVIFQAYKEGRLLNKITPDLKAVDVTTDGESINHGEDMSIYTIDELKAMKAIADKAKARQCQPLAK
jgi:hypothetical protein